VPVLLAVVLVVCQTGESMSRMLAAVERQRQSVRKQVKGAPGAFFLTAWNGSTVADNGAPRVDAPCEPVPAAELRKLIVEASVREGLNPLLLRAVVQRESGGRPCAVSPKGAEGLMQLMPGTAADLGVRNSLDPAENMAAGARYLKQMMDRYKGDLRLALAAYNAGPQRVDEAGGIPAIAETQSYVSAILAQMDNTAEAMQ
jgi:soluble lytic murein transglycosylase-like protein